MSKPTENIVGNLCDSYKPSDNGSGLEEGSKGGGGRGGRLSSSNITPVVYEAMGEMECEKMMEVEEVDVEDFCLEDELKYETGTERGREGRRQEEWKPPTGSAIHSASIGRSNHILSLQLGLDGNVRRKTGGGCLGGDDSEDVGQLGRAVTEKEASGVRKLIFGNRSKEFNEAWKKQGFYFCRVDGLRYGLVQAEGGPCGALAVVQAFFLEVSAAPKLVVR